MTREEITELLREWQSFLLLDHWTVVIDWDNEPENPDAAADIFIPSTRHYGRLRFASDVFGTDEADVATRICHELLHLRLNNIEVTTKTLLMQSLKYDEQCLIADMMRLEIERAIDALTTALIRNVGIRPKRADGVKLGMGEPDGVKTGGNK